MYVGKHRGTVTRRWSPNVTTWLVAAVMVTVALVTLVGCTPHQTQHQTTPDTAERLTTSRGYAVLNLYREAIEQARSEHDAFGGGK
jgi:hypothetical protein